MTASKKSNATSAGTAKSPDKSPAKRASPPRKATISRESRATIASNCQVKFTDVGIEDICVARIYKPNGFEPAFVGPINKHLNDEINEDKRRDGNIVLISQQKKSKMENELLETPSQTGAKYYTDVYVLTTDNAISFHEAAGNLTRVFNDVSRNEARDGFKYGHPTFVNKGNNTPPTKPCLHDYLLDRDCITILKRAYKGADTKYELMNNEFRDDILEIVFGDSNVGYQIVNELDDETYEQY